MMTTQQKNIAGLAHFSYIAYEYWQASHEEMIRLGILYNSTRYKARFTANRAQKKKLTKEMEKANRILKKSIMDEGKHLEALTNMADGLTNQDAVEKITEALYDTFDTEIAKLSK